MMAYDQQPENEYQETSKEMRFATAVFTAVAAGDVVSSLAALPSMAAWDWIFLWRALATGLVAGGVAYAFVLVVVTIAPGLPALLLMCPPGSPSASAHGRILKHYPWRRSRHLKKSRLKHRRVQSGSAGSITWTTATAVCSSTAIW